MLINTKEKRNNQIKPSIIILEYKLTIILEYKKATISHDVLVEHKDQDVIVSKID